MPSSTLVSYQPLHFVSAANRFAAQGQEADAFDSGDEEVVDSDDEESDEPAKKKAKRSS